MNTITTNQEHIRLKLYEGKIDMDEAAQELVDGLKRQCEALNKQNERLVAENQRLRDEKEWYEYRHGG